MVWVCCATVILRLCGAETPLAESATVTVKLKGLPEVLDGVPAITPVLELSDRPGGSDPDVSDQPLYGGVPPRAESDWEYGMPAVPEGKEVVVMEGMQPFGLTHRTKGFAGAVSSG
jgi:hypothetical protein